MIPIRNLRVSLGKRNTHMNDAELILPRKRDRFHGHGHHAFGTWHKTEDSFLKIQRQKRRFLRIEFHALSFCIWAASCHDVSAMRLKSSPALKTVICSCLSSSAMARESQAFLASLVFLRRVMPLAVSLMLIWRPSVG
jgi:hypothetical protein